ncbi:MAG TPA: beta-L-arabinofuranosidase domain-containing protein [Terracidiphilus sp.]|nr:beta-L-arabinofuranosidase domain-containing protein [Terracidiphilus sp.]
MNRDQHSVEMTLAAQSNDNEPAGEPNRREFMAGLTGAAVLASLAGVHATAQAHDKVLNIARVALPSSVAIQSENKIGALNDGFAPANSFDRSHGVYGLWGDRESHSHATWVQYDWSEPVSINKVEVFWAIDHPRAGVLPGSSWPTMHVPESYRILYWNGKDFAPVNSAQGLGLAADAFNATTFQTITTNKIRLEVTPQKGLPAGILEWKVYHAGAVPALRPVINAGVDRSVILGAQTYLAGKVIWLEDSPKNVSRWVKTSGPGSVTFTDATASNATAQFSAPGEYVLTLAASGTEDRSHSIHVHVEPAPPADRLDVVYTRPYSIDSPLWNQRAKALIVDWIPHCIAMCEREDIAPMRGDGGIDNFIEAAKANRGESHGRHKGYVFSNAWVHQTVESMCIALMVDAHGDPEIIKAQELMQATLERWIPVILAAQMPDGYLQTAYILADRKDWPERWSPDHRGNHEGYVSGYFIESAINHYTLTDGKDLRLYNAAKKLADCWVANIGPGKKEWFDGHQEMEQALVRFGRFVNDQEGNHRGDPYISLAKFLLDSRRGGSEYDQSHLPPGQQYEAVGHAVRAMYFYSGMADIAAETQDRDYQSAVISLWDNMVNKKYYVTGGIGSGETSEGFGPNYSLRNEAYCETCSSCGVVFFQYKLNLAYHDAKYADLYEQTMYNALLGGVALDGKSFCYTNPLANTERARWHICPCCVGNLARTLLMVPTWSYVKSKDALYVNMFIGSRIHVGKVAGTDVEIVQKTEYPWQGSVSITVNPEEAKTFSLYMRIPDRTTSKLYQESPALHGVKHFAVNGQEQTPTIQKGYAVLTREWKPGDRIELELPMEPQRVRADQRIQADTDLVALKYGPLVYNVENADNGTVDRKLGNAPLRAEWRPDLLGGVMVITGQWQDGSPMVAIPNFARANRVGPPPEYPTDRDPDRWTRPKPAINSKVWI